MLPRRTHLGAHLCSVTHKLNLGALSGSAAYRTSMSSLICVVVSETLNLTSLPQASCPQIVYGGEAVVPVAVHHLLIAVQKRCGPLALLSLA